MSERLCVVMPVYNEQDAIGPVLEKWDAVLKALGISYEIRPYNDGSRDGSLDVMRSVAQRIGPQISVRDKPNGGHGNTILTGYREAAADGFDWIFQIDSDDEMGPERFNELWSRRNDYDFLVGIRHGRRQALPRKIVSFVSRLCVRLFYGKSVWDVNTPYRLMRVSAFKDFYSQIPMTTFAPNVILSGLAARHKLRCFETPVPQHDRTTGEVSIKKWKLLKAAAKSFWQTVVFSFGIGNSPEHECGDFWRQVLADVKSTPWWMLLGLGFVIFAVYGITFTFPSMVYDFASAKGDRFQVFLTYFFMRRYTEGAISALFYDFSPIWSNVTEVLFLFGTLVLLGVLGKRLNVKGLPVFIGLVLWAVSPVVYDRLVGQHCVPSHGIALFVDSIALLLFHDIRNARRISWRKILLLEGCIMFSTGEYQAHVNLLLTAFLGVCLVAPRKTLREWFDDLKLVAITLGIGVVGWFLLSYGPILIAKAMGVSIPPSGGAHDHVFWFDGQRSFLTNLKSLAAGLVIDFGYISFFVLGIRLAVFAWCAWMVKSLVATLRGRPIMALYMATFAMSPLVHPVMQCSTSVMRAQFWFMPFVAVSYMLCCNWALSRKTFFRRIVILLLSLCTLESCHETATLFYFRWKVLEQDRLHASVVATDLWRLYGTKLSKPVFTIGYLGRYPTNWDDLRPCRFFPLINNPFSRLHSNMYGYGHNCPREVFMYLRELVGFVCTMPEESICKSLAERADLITTKPAYPEPGYIFEEDGVIVVNFGDPDSKWESFDYANWRTPNEELLFRTLRLNGMADFLRKHIYLPAKELSKAITNY